MKKKLPEIDTLLPAGTCPDDPDTLHVVGFKDGEPVLRGHGHLAEEGKPLLPGSSLYHVDSDGRVASVVSVPSHGGPAQVATKAYRDNYDAIFGAKKNRKKELN